MQGIDLLRLLIEASDLPEAAVERELNQLLARAGLQAETVTLDDVRELMSTYLQEVLLEAKTTAG